MTSHKKCTGLSGTNSPAFTARSRRIGSRSTAARSPLQIGPGVFLKDEISRTMRRPTFEKNGDRSQARIGYELFHEIRTSADRRAACGQRQHPTLEFHIAFLRELILECGIPLVEIPPVPEGFKFIACLTHDVDHPSIRQHKWDHTALGFVYRATLGIPDASFSVGRFP